MLANTLFDWDLIRRYDTTGPRYTSYPTALQFTDAFTVADYRRHAERSNGPEAKPLSLYFHIPFCSTLCFYCACNKIVTKNKSKGEEYLHRLLIEIALQAQLFDRHRQVQQVHLGGGTPTFLSVDQLSRLLHTVDQHFEICAEEQQRDFSIEVDPRSVDGESIHGLRELGFNRLSLGVQDFDAQVQRAVHRIQPQEQTLEILAAARTAGFRSINVDLIYGLPLQTQASFRTTVEAIIDAAPDRLCIFNYAHLPQRFAPQQRIRAQDLPSADEKLAILQQTVTALTDAGYRYIGMDHFARPDDDLSRAQDDGTLYRNFQGYTTHADCDLVGLGVSSIARVGDCYSQNHHDTDNYYRVIDDEQQLPVLRGVTLSADDILRRDVINELMCYGLLDISALERHHQICFAEYFQAEQQALNTLAQDGLLEIGTSELRVTAIGRALVRNICMVFDRYLAQHSDQRFSRAI